ncbi:hypothetical protein KDK95_27730 [Actinospica sp. MGRD01-02]|uniref:Glyoxalase-like domain-containing protein n=1 Tax=Actinospica acidithermotolerans TaxID=2828514 RepID=A0A941EGE2_9ACTN|nr:VOC family protein [Actinospica acidithermotolerans]MBR7830125.1 hypothetical protein [Actinospica acidithermotolerans]
MKSLSEFWTKVLGEDVVDGANGLALSFVEADGPKQGKNRVHLDLKGGPEQLERLLKLGAVRADIGQGEVPWVVLADPEGNEFCLQPPTRADGLGGDTPLGSGAVADAAVGSATAAGDGSTVASDDSSATASGAGSATAAGDGSAVAPDDSTATASGAGSATASGAGATVASADAPSGSADSGHDDWYERAVGIGVRWTAVCQDAADPRAQSRFWTAAAGNGWQVAAEGDWGLAMRHADDARSPMLVLGPPLAEKTGPSRVYLRVSANPGSHAAVETSRLVVEGARRAGGLLLDPESNEFGIS